MGVEDEIGVNEKMKLKLKYIHLYSVLFLLFVMDIPCIQHFFWSIYLKPFMFARVVLCAILLVPVLIGFIFQKKSLTIGFWMILLCSVWTLAVNLLNRGNLYYGLTTMSSPLLVALFLEINKNRISDVIKSWAFILRILTYIDAFTMFLFPTGMYASAMYTNYWFLGYKTERLIFCLPMIVFTCYNDFKEKGKFGIRCYWVLLISLFTTRFSEGTAAFYCLLVFGLIVVLSDFKSKLGIDLDLVYSMMNFKLIIPLYAVATFLTINIADSPLIQYIVTNILGKSLTLTTRTHIWDSLIPEIQKKLITGYGLIEASAYVKITGNPYATSAHNMLLQIMMTGGIALLVIYVVGIFACSHISNRKYTVPEIIVIAGIIAELIVGITSSAIVFSTFGFVLYHVLSLEIQQGNQDLNKQSESKHFFSKPRIRFFS